MPLGRYLGAALAGTAGYLQGRVTGEQQQQQLQRQSLLDALRAQQFQAQMENMRLSQALAQQQFGLRREQWDWTRGAEERARARALEVQQQLLPGYIGDIAARDEAGLLGVPQIATGRPGVGLAAPVSTGLVPGLDEVAGPRLTTPRGLGAPAGGPGGVGMYKPGGAIGGGWRPGGPGGAAAPVGREQAGLGAPVLPTDLATAGEVLGQPVPLERFEQEVALQPAVAAAMPAGAGRTMLEAQLPTDLATRPLSELEAMLTEGGAAAAYGMARGMGPEGVPFMEQVPGFWQAPMSEADFQAARMAKATELADLEKTLADADLATTKALVAADPQLGDLAVRGYEQDAKEHAQQTTDLRLQLEIAKDERDERKLRLDIIKAETDRLIAEARATLLRAQAQTELHPPMTRHQTLTDPYTAETGRMRALIAAQEAATRLQEAQRRQKEFEQDVREWEEGGKKGKDPLKEREHELRERGLDLQEERQDQLRREWEEEHGIAPEEEAEEQKAPTTAPEGGAAAAEAAAAVEPDVVAPMVSVARATELWMAKEWGDLHAERTTRLPLPAGTELEVIGASKGWLMVRPRGEGWPRPGVPPRPGVMAMGYEAWAEGVRGERQNYGWIPGEGVTWGEQYQRRTIGSTGLYTRGKGGKAVRQESLKSGATVYAVKEPRGSAWSLVVTADGKTGWVARRKLSGRPKAEAPKPAAATPAPRPLGPLSPYVVAPWDVPETEAPDTPAGYE